MKVLILPSWYPSPNAPFDGIFIQEQAEALSRAGLDVTVLHGNLNIAQVMKDTEVSMAVENGVKVIRKSGFAFPKANFYLLQKWAKRHKDLFEKYIELNGAPDIIHAHSFIAGHLGKLLKEISGAPLLLTEHHSELLRLKQNRRYIAFAKDCYDHCDQIIAVSSALKNAINTMTQTPVEVIPNLVDKNLFYPKEKKSTSNTDLKILGVGSFDRNKGYEDLIKAVTFIEQSNSTLEVSLDLIGEGPLKEKFVALSHSAKKNVKIRIHEPMSKTQLAAYYRAADVFCLPSQIETFGIVLVESLACGTPVVATSQGGPRDIIQTGFGKFAEYGKPKTLAKAIIEVFSKKDIFGPKEIARIANERFGEQSVVNRIVVCYEKLLN